MSGISSGAAEALLRDLVAIASPSREEAQATEFLVNWMRSVGYDDAFVDEAGNAVGLVGGDKSCQSDIILLGHIDTFAGFPPVALKNRKLYGRGAVDAKGPLCAFAVAARRAKLADGLRVIVVGAVEEEAATSKGARHVLGKYHPDYCIIGEPSRWDRITLGYKGRLLVDWRWQGGLSHSAGEAPSPAEIAVDYWLRLKERVARHNKAINSIFTRLDVSLRDMRTYQDDVNGVAEMTLGFRLPPGVAPSAAAALLDTVDGATITTRGAESAVTADKNSALSRVFRRAIRASGGTPRFVYKTGTSDMNIAGPGWGCPIVAYGPGDSALDHRPDEHINLDEYLRAIDVLTAVLEFL